MAINGVYPAAAFGASSANTAASKAGTDKLSTRDFLRLMAAQLQNQTMFDQTDNSQFLAQLAHFSTLSKLSELARTIKASTAISLLGKNVTVPDGSGGYTTGIVSSVGMQDGVPYVRVNDTYYSITDLLEIENKVAAGGLTQRKTKKGDRNEN